MNLSDHYKSNEKRSQKRYTSRETEKSSVLQEVLLDQNFGRHFLVCPDVFRQKEKSFRLEFYRTAVSQLFRSVRPKSFCRDDPAKDPLLPNFPDLGYLDHGKRY